MIDCTKGVQYLNEIKDSVVAGFQWASKEVIVFKFIFVLYQMMNLIGVNTMIIPSLRRPDIIKKFIFLFVQRP